MKVLLVNPEQEPDIDDNLPSFVDQVRGSLPPLGLMYVASYAQKCGHDVRISDESIGTSTTDIVKEFQPDVVGITATTFTMLKALSVARKVKNISLARVVLGGVHASIYPEETVKLDCIDHVVCGEGEYAFIELLKKIENKTILPREIVRSDTFIEDLDQLPLPDRRMTDWTRYQSALDGTGYVTTIVTSRGCPYNCVFCHRPHMGRRFRARSAENVISEIDHIKLLGINEITFYDDTFAVDRDRVMTICDYLIRGRYNLKWDIRTRVNLVDREMLQKLHKAGCKQIRYGVEASSNRILQAIGKGITIEQAEKAIRWTREAGIESLTYFILGSPYETPEDWDKTIQFARRLNPDYVYFAIMTPYPATPLYTKWLQGQENHNGHQRTDHWYDFACNPRPIDTPYYQDWEDRKLLEETLKRAYQKFYFRPRYLLKKASQIRSARDMLRGLNIMRKMVIG